MANFEGFFPLSFSLDFLVMFQSKNYIWTPFCSTEIQLNESYLEKLLKFQNLQPQKFT